MEFARLNAMGETVGSPTNQPTSRIGQGNQKQVQVLYGHEGGGKAYTYLADENVRAGDIVTPRVSHHKSGKEYSTLGRVVATRDSMGSAAGDTAAHLSGQGIMLKTLGPTDQASLPGYYKGWGKDAKAAYDLQKEARLGGASKSELSSIKRYTDSARRESKQKYEAVKMSRTNHFGQTIGG